MTNYIQFQDNHPVFGFMVSVAYQEGADILALAKFEATRIKSLRSRDIQIVSEIRKWNNVRMISEQIK